MATYQDFKPDPKWGPKKMYEKIADLLTGAYSVEVLRQPDKTVVFRTWADRHCDPTQHQQLPTS